MVNNIQEALRKDLGMGKASSCIKMVVNMMGAGYRENSQERDTTLMWLEGADSVCGRMANANRGLSSENDIAVIYSNNVK